jgi:hypothetical protein
MKGDDCMRIDQGILLEISLWDDGCLLTSLPGTFRHKRARTIEGHHFRCNPCGALSPFSLNPPPGTKRLFVGDACRVGIQQKCHQLECAFRGLVHAAKDSTRGP